MFLKQSFYPYYLCVFRTCSCLILPRCVLILFKGWSIWLGIDSSIETWQPGTACKPSSMSWKEGHPRSPSIICYFRLNEDLVVKVGDFGFARDVYANDYYQVSDNRSVKLPVKWMAPESFNDRISTEKTDVVGITTGVVWGASE